MIMKPTLKDKDVLGYFMLTTKELVDLQKFNPAYREEQLTALLQKAFWRLPATAACSANCRSCCSHRGTSNHDFSTRRRSDE
jgi:hypothetical protein